MGSRGAGLLLPRADRDEAGDQRADGSQRCRAGPPTQRTRLPKPADPLSPPMARKREWCGRPLGGEGPGGTCPGLPAGPGGAPRPRPPPAALTAAASLGGSGRCPRRRSAPGLLALQGTSPAGALTCSASPAGLCSSWLPSSAPGDTSREMQAWETRHGWASFLLLPRQSPHGQQAAWDPLTAVMFCTPQVFHG